MPVRVRLWARGVRRIGRFFLRTLFFISGGWIILLIGLYLVLSSEEGQSLARRWLINLLSQSLQTEVEIERIELIGIAHLSLKHLILYDKACQPFVKAREVRIGWLPSAFWQGFWRGEYRIPFSTILLQQPEVFIYTEKASGLTNVDRLFGGEERRSSSRRRGWRVSLASLELREGRFRWIDSTASSFLQPSPGYLRYENLYIDSLFLDASIEWYADGYLFAEVASLCLRERHSGMWVPTLRFVLQAHPDHTEIHHFYLRLPRSEIQGQAHFLKEGLDQLFRNTETKYFKAELNGSLDWEEVAAFSGSPLPVKGRWQVDLKVQGDLYHFQIEKSLITLSPKEYVRASGEIVHYAKPQLMHWKAEIAEASLSLQKLKEILPDLIMLPQEVRSDYVWSLRGTHSGRLHEYEAKLEVEGSTAFSFRMERDSGWRYTLQAFFDSWNSQGLFSFSPFQSLSGTASVEGRGFRVGELSGRLIANLQGREVHGHSWGVRGAFEFEKGMARGSFHLSTPYGGIDYEGIFPLLADAFYEGTGRFSGLRASLWGAEGSLTGMLHLKGQGIPWEAGWSHVNIDSLQWERSDSLYDLGSLYIAMERGGICEVRGQGLAFRGKAKGDWLHGVTLLSGYWLKGDTISQDTLFRSWEIEGTLSLHQPFWGHLLGLPLPLHLYGSSLYLHLISDSLPTRGILRCALDTLKWEGWRVEGSFFSLKVEGDSIWAEAGSTRGKAYVPYEMFEAHTVGTIRGGRLQCSALFSERHDTISIAFHWRRKGKEFEVEIEPLLSTLYLGSHHWHFAEVHPVFVNIETGEWQLHRLRLEGGASELAIARKAGLFLLSLNRFPLAIAAELLGMAVPIEGYLSILWQELQSGPRFAVIADSLKYEGLSYPRLQLIGEPVGDSIPFRFSLEQGNQVFLQARGSYRKSDTLSPLFVEMRGIRLPTHWLRPFLAENVQNPRGFFVSQRILIRGTPEKPLFYGELLCDKVSFYLPITRVLYTMDGVLRLRGDTIFFPDVELRESREKRGYITGHIALQGWRPPFLSLMVRVRDKPFLLAASSAASDAYLYGTVELERGFLSISGSWDNPMIRGEVLLSSATDLTLPLRTYERSIAAEHVRFVDVQADAVPALPPSASVGADLRVGISSVPEARFRLLFDERTGDEISAQGAANLLLSIDRTGRMSLAGSYEVRSGEYRVNLQGLASKRLLLEPGSRITWDGDLYQGQMDIVATYRTLTSLRMIDTSFSYTLPVELRVILQGSLLSPVMRFQIDIPSLSGTPTPLVNLFLQRLATDEQERNRQVFALLVLGTFVPVEQGFGPQQVSSGVSSTLAEFLSAQLANWVGQTLGSQIGVAFTLGEWNELSARLRLSLGQRFVLERDGVLIGPGQNTAALGNLSARYRLLPKQLTQPTQWQLEVEGFSRQTFLWGAAGATSQGAGLRLRKSFFLPERRRKLSAAP
ncbi:MAG: translocation/assembly module TamB domain-containing protein [Bacteroidia bacterium]|nr:translocation/assembly module TamB domain-containing protein [Bacteroidia bacterium]MDW8014662.1 translocation/assembly module TamB domain-containing protein [Bacteroidia bacterium]